MCVCVVLSVCYCVKMLMILIYDTWAEETCRVCVCFFLWWDEINCQAILEIIQMTAKKSETIDV